VLRIDQQYAPHIAEGEIFRDRTCFRIFADQFESLSQLLAK
jgi:hypothetical protein